MLLWLLTNALQQPRQNKMEHFLRWGAASYGTVQSIFLFELERSAGCRQASH